MLDNIGPHELKQLTCKGCSSLKLEPWEKDSGDESGIGASCSLADKNGLDGFITIYWSKYTPTSEWCPALTGDKKC